MLISRERRFGISLTSRPDQFLSTMAGCGHSADAEALPAPCPALLPARGRRDAHPSLPRLPKPSADEALQGKRHRGSRSRAAAMPGCPAAEPAETHRLDRRRSPPGRTNPTIAQPWQTIWRHDPQLRRCQDPAGIRLPSPAPVQRERAPLYGAATVPRRQHVTGVPPAPCPDPALLDARATRRA